jgi:hypothetical protein
MQRPKSELEMELAGVRQELVEVRMERNLLKIDEPLRTPISPRSHGEVGSNGRLATALPDCLDEPGF